MLYRVTWTIDIDANTPTNAAKKARDIQLDPKSIATVFDVAPHQSNGPGHPTSIDLLALNGKDGVE